VKSLYKQISNLLPFHFVWALQLQMRHPSWFSLMMDYHLLSTKSSFWFS
jgi:hypothetical protein